MITDKLIQDRDYFWVDVTAPDKEDFDRLNSEYDLSYLLAQDCLKPDHLPKYESGEENDFLILRSFDPESTEESLSAQDLTRKIALFITDSRLITIHRVELDYLTSLSNKFSKNPPRDIQGLVHELILAIIRSYEAPIHGLQDLYDEFEDDVLSKRIEDLSTTRIYLFRRRLFLIKRMLKLSKDSLYHFKEFWEEHPSLLQDLKENIDQIYFSLDEISNNFEHLFELYISLTNQRTNEVMKVLTVFSSILLPLNFIASFYGMNFKYLPGLQSVHSIYFLILLMLSLSIAAVWYFKKKGWFNSARD